MNNKFCETCDFKNCPAHQSKNLIELYSGKEGFCEKREELQSKIENNREKIFSYKF
jgi:hypothetical protein